MFESHVDTNDMTATIKQEITDKQAANYASWQTHRRTTLEAAAEEEATVMRMKATTQDIEATREMLGENSNVGLTVGWNDQRRRRRRSISLPYAECPACSSEEETTTATRMEETTQDTDATAKMLGENSNVGLWRRRRRRRTCPAATAGCVRRRRSARRRSFPSIYTEQCGTPNGHTETGGSDWSLPQGFVEISAAQKALAKQKIEGVLKAAIVSGGRGIVLGVPRRNTFKTRVWPHPTVNMCPCKAAQCSNSDMDSNKDCYPTMHLGGTSDMPAINRVNNWGVKCGTLYDKCPSGTKCGVVMTKIAYLADEELTDEADSDRCSLQFEAISTMFKIGIVDVSTLGNPASYDGKTVVGFITRLPDDKINTSDPGLSVPVLGAFGRANCFGDDGVPAIKAKKKRFLSNVDELLREGLSAARFAINKQVIYDIEDAVEDATHRRRRTHTECPACSYEEETTTATRMEETTQDTDATAKMLGETSNVGVWRRRRRRRRTPSSNRRRTPKVVDVSR